MRLEDVFLKMDTLSTGVQQFVCQNYNMDSKLEQSVVINLATLATLASNLYPQKAFKIPWKPKESSG